MYVCSDFINYFDELLNDYAQNPLIIVGDSNIDLFQNPHYTELQTMFQNYDCRHAHNVTIRQQADQVFSNFCGRIFLDSVECNLSDHNIVSCNSKMMLQLKNMLK